MAFLYLFSELESNILKFYGHIWELVGALRKLSISFIIILILPRIYMLFKI